MQNQHPEEVPLPRASAMTDEERLSWLKHTAVDLNLTWMEVSRYTGYSHSTVAAWFTNIESVRHRPVPARAIDRLQLEMKAGNVRGSK